MPAFPFVPGQVPVLPAAAQAQPKKKEKPRVKTPIPGTDWLRVKTTEGNTFYTHKVEKRSVWTVPEEIKDAVAQLEKAEAGEHVDKQRREEEAKRTAEEEQRKEAARVKAEVKAGKRKAQDPVPVEEVVISKKAKMDEEEAEEDAEDDGEDEDEDDEEDSDMEDWQREAAEQLAREAEEEKKRQEEERKREEEEQARLRAEAEAQKNRPLNMPDKVELSTEEAKALFKVRRS